MNLFSVSWSLGCSCVLNKVWLCGQTQGSCEGRIPRWLPPSGLCRMSSVPPSCALGLLYCPSLNPTPSRLYSPNLDLSLPHEGLKHRLGLPLGLDQPSKVGKGVVELHHCKARKNIWNFPVCPLGVQIRKFGSRNGTNGLLMMKATLEVIAELE